MERKYVVQARVGEKWKSVYNGPDKTKTQQAYRAAVAEVGGEAVRVLRSDGLKEDGKTKWVMARAPQKAGQQAAKQKSGDWFTEAKAYLAPYISKIGNQFNLITQRLVKLLKR